MKYLRRFNESTHEELEEQLSEEKQWIKDSLLELVDARCIIAVSPFEVKSIGRPGLRISIQSTNGRLIPISVGDHLLTIDSYLKEKGFVGFRPYDYDNPYSASRHQVTVNAMLKDIKNMFENELSQFVKMLDRFDTNAPFDSISVSYYKPKTEINEAKIIVDKEVRLDVEDILLELDDCGIQYDIRDKNYYKDGVNPYPCFKVSMKDSKYQFFRLEDIMDVLLRLKEYLKMTNFSIDMSIPNSDEYYPMDVFMEDFKGEELYNLNLYIWRGFGLTW